MESRKKSGKFVGHKMSVLFFFLQVIFETFFGPTNIKRCLGMYAETHIMVFHVMFVLLLSDFSQILCCYLTEVKLRFPVFALLIG